MKEIIDIVHKSIYPFFDVCENEEEPLSDKDKLLLKVNKAICNNLKALEQEPCKDAISIPYLMHKEMDIPLLECQKAYDVAIDYLRSQGKVKG